MSSKNRIKLDICGAEYVVISDESEEYMQQIAALVDDDMRQMLEKNSRVSIAMAGVLCALKYCDEFVKTKKGEDNLRDQIKNYIEECTQYRNQIDGKNNEINGLKKQINDLKIRLQNSEDKVSDLTSENNRIQRFNSKVPKEEVRIDNPAKDMNDPEKIEEVMRLFKIKDKEN